MSILKDIIESHSVLKYDRGKDSYIYHLVWCVPMHNRKLIECKSGKKSSKIVSTDPFYKDLENNKILKRSVFSTTGGVYQGKFYGFGDKIGAEFWVPLDGSERYALTYLCIKNGINMWSEKGLLKMKEKYPEFLYENRIL